MDAERPFGNGWCLPAGLLREARQAAGRADLVILTRCPEAGRPDAPLPGKPLCCARHNLADLLPLAGGEALTFEALKGRKVVVFSGIAEPQSFVDGLLRRGLHLSAVLSFPDHVVYNDARVAELESLIDSCGADFAITTEKDGVKLDHLPQETTAKILQARLDLALDDPTPLTGLLCNLLQK